MGFSSFLLPRPLAPASGPECGFHHHPRRPAVPLTGVRPSLPWTRSVLSAQWTQALGACFLEEMNETNGLTNSLIRPGCPQNRTVWGEMAGVGTLSHPSTRVPTLMSHFCGHTHIPSGHALVTELQPLTHLLGMVRDSRERPGRDSGNVSSSMNAAPLGCGTVASVCCLICFLIISPSLSTKGEIKMPPLLGQREDQVR